MGLLRKAAAAVPVGDTSASQSSVEPVLSRAGLLKRSIQALASPPQPVVETADLVLEPAPGLSVSLAADQESVVRQISAESRSLVDGVELPSRFFTTLRKKLSIAKGALLLYDPLRLEYAPWASFGLDQTTLHRLRIPLGANDTFNALANGEPLEVAAPELLSSFQKFFSSREFSSLARIFLCPFIHDETLVGVLIATEMQHSSLDTAGLLSCLKGIAAEMSPALQKARGFLMKLNQARATQPPAAPEERIARLLESPAARQKKMLFLSLAMGPYVRGIASAHEDLDVFRLREDVRNLMDAFLADVGVSVMLPAGNVLVCLQDTSKDDIPLFLHQLRYFLNVHFAGAPTPERAPRIDILRSRVWPDEGTDPTELVAFFSS